MLHLGTMVKISIPMDDLEDNPMLRQYNGKISRIIDIRNTGTNNSYKHYHLRDALSDSDLPYSFIADWLVEVHG